MRGFPCKYSTFANSYLASFRNSPGCSGDFMSAANLYHFRLVIALFAGRNLPVAQVGNLLFRRLAVGRPALGTLAPSFQDKCSSKENLV
jgi:hypothetical protein